TITANESTDVTVNVTDNATGDVLGGINVEITQGGSTLAAGTTVRGEFTATLNVSQTSDLTVTVSGNGYETTTATITVEEEQIQPPEVVPGSPATDPDDDGVYEDVNGDGQVLPGDAIVLFNAVFNNEVSEDDTRLDINGDGSVLPGDATVLFEAAFNNEIL
ncbi:MAG: dockerin type I domain-containing protein, partial [Haloarculaceae archaeon]